jgi:hypothetical protein
MTGGDDKPSVSTTSMTIKVSPATVPGGSELTEKFWLLRWIDGLDIRSVRDVETAISDDSNFQDLASIATEARTSPGEDTRTNNPVVGGRGIDLSGELIAANEYELIEEVDKAFGRTWHYFDEVVVEGLTARRFTKMLADGNYDLARERARAHCILLLHLRKISALDNVVFRQKPDPCLFHGNDMEALEAAGLRKILDDRPSVVQRLAEDGTLHDVEDHYIHGEHFHYVFEHPLVGVRAGHIAGSPACRDEDELKQMISDDIFNLYAGYAAADAAMASEISAPLATSSPMLESILDADEGADAATGSVGGKVAVEIGLPILDGVPAADLIKIREDEADAFERFRAALRAAINEAVRSDIHSTKPHGISANIIEETLVPALHDIDQRLHVAQKVLHRKSAMNVSVGAALVAVGLIAGIPLLLPAGFAMGTAVPGVNFGKYLDDKGQVELSDLYFIWKLQSLRI